MINILIQIFSLSAALIVNFFVPWVYGLEAYGEFIKANAIAYAIAKLLDAFNEPFLNSLEKSEVLIASAILNGTVLGAFYLISVLTDMGSYLLLASMLATATVLISLYANLLTNHILNFLILLLGTFCIILGLEQVTQLKFGILNIITVSNLVPAAYGLMVLLMKTKVDSIPFAKMRTVLLSIPSLLSLSLISNFWYNISPMILGRFLSSADVGLLRVSMSAVQASSSVFPISIRVILVSFKNDSVHVFEKFRNLVGASFIYFSAGVLATYIGALVYPPLLKFVFIIQVAPFYYWTLIAERFLWATHKTRFAGWLNCYLFTLMFIASFFVRDLRDAFQLYALSYVIYLLALRYHLPERLKKFLPWYLIAVVPLAPLAGQESTYVGAAIAAAFLLFGVVKFRMDRDMIKVWLGTF